MTRTAVMRGSTNEFDLPTLMQALSISRQYTGIEVSDDRGGLVGRIFLKSGTVVSAETPRRKGLGALHELVHVGSGYQFFVFRTEMADVRGAIGTLADVLMSLLDGGRAEAAEADDRVEVMRGRTDECDLLSLMQIVGIGRQFVAIELIDPLGLPLGTVYVKAGHVVSAVAGDLLDLDALRLLLRHKQRSAFFVYRSPFRGEPDPLGPIDEVLRRAMSDGPPSRGAEPTRPPPPSVRSAGTNGAAAAKNGVAAAPVKNGVAAATAKNGVVAAAAKNGVEATFAKNGIEAAVTNLNGAESSRGVNRVEPLASSRASEAPVSGTNGVAVAAASVQGVEAAIATAAVMSEVSMRGPSSGPDAGAPPAVASIDARDEGAGSGRRSAGPGAVPILCLASVKGGVGRTTIALNLAVALARRGKRVVLVDADPSNGVAVALNAEGRFSRGLYDVLAGQATLDEIVVPTSLPGLRLVPAGGEARSIGVDGQGRDWQGALERLRVGADLVLVDAPAGVHGLAAEVLAHATHVAAVLQAEPAAMRSFARFERSLQGITAQPPTLLGVIINMLDYRARSSVATLQEACRDTPPELLFDIPITRSPAFLDASALGVPLAPVSAKSAPSVAWLFEVLASSVLEKLGLWAPQFEALQLV